MAAISRGYGAKIIKNVGDSLVYYFPQTSNISRWSAFKNVLESGLTMIEAHGIINMKLHEEKLPSVNYRISADYGRVEMAKSTTSMSDDMFGTTINMCSKINLKAPNNGMVIGGDLYQILRESFPLASKEYSFKEIGEYSVELKQSYPIYVVISKIERRAGTEVNPLVITSVSPQYKQSRSHNIILVEDQADLAFTYNAMLSEEGWNIKVFIDAEEALNHFAEVHPWHYNIAILDIRMPKLNGLQLFYRLKSLSPNIKIVFISALDAAEELVSILPGVSYGDIIKKPVRREQFIDRVRRALM
jgi:CheY-like chemotaxis protein